MIIKYLSVFFLFIILTTSARVEHLKLDLSVSGQPGGATSFTNWAIVNSMINTHKATFGDIVCIIKMTAPPLSSTQYLRCGYNGKNRITYNCTQLATGWLACTRDPVNECWQ